jgi:hypothetical protein
MKKLWIVEIWEEHREVFKSIIAHIIIFVIFILGLKLIEKILYISGLAESKKELIETIDYIVIIVTLVILALGFMMKVIIFNLRGMR